MIIPRMKIKVKMYNDRFFFFAPSNITSYNHIAPVFDNIYPSCRARDEDRNSAAAFETLDVDEDGDVIDERALLGCHGIPDARALSKMRPRKTRCAIRKAAVKRSGRKRDWK